MLKDQMKQQIINQVGVFKPFGQKENSQTRKKGLKTKTPKTCASQKGQSQGSMAIYTHYVIRNWQNNKASVEFKNSMLLT